MAKPRSNDEIREAFLCFFEDQERDHLRMPAASLIPAGDPTLLLTNAGMTQFKAYFSGEANPPHPRITTAQPSFRTTDIDVVGDATHLTLFEMLGNFSFGDYFKDEACAWALEFWTDVLQFPVERLYVTVHHVDDEAVEIWLKLGILEERIWRFGDEDNWWGPAGDEGPCGPCSELHYYRGDLDAVPSPGDPRRGTEWGPNHSDDIVELYNLVFTQYYHHLDGVRTELPYKNIDTGMGLERTSAAVQEVDSIFDTDIFSPLVDRVSELSGIQYGHDTETDRAIRVVAEHGRSATFLIGDGVVPGNTGRGYVLRRVIRRAMRFGLQLGLKEIFLSEIAEVTADQMGHVYPALAENLPFVRRVLDTEEQRFSDAVAAGSNLLDELIDSRDEITALMKMLTSAKSPWETADLGEALANAQSQLAPHRHGATAEVTGILERVYTTVAETDGASPALVGEVWDSFLEENWKGVITGYEAAYLYDTYGFPIEVTVEMASERGLKTDTEGFERLMEEHRERGRAAARFGGTIASHRVYENLGVDETPFLGYDPETATRAETLVVAVIKDGKLCERASAGEDIELILRESPFYAERGGQIGDTGSVEGSSGYVKVTDTQNPYARLIVHTGNVSSGEIVVGDTMAATVDADRRERIMRNHTGTHLLHAALRQVLGTHVRQAGSLVAPDRLRFDFTHIASMSRDEVLDVQRVINDHIRANEDVEAMWTTYREAIDCGALAFFGDKYDETDVRTIMIDAPWSYELCGGTHCQHTGDIGSFYILSEQSIGSGLRRIEAVTGKGAEDLVSARLLTVDRMARQLQVPVMEVAERITALQDDVEAGQRRVTELEAAVLRASVGGSNGGSEQTSSDLTVSIGDQQVPVQVRKVDAPNIDALRKTGDYLRDRLDSGIVVLGSAIDGRPMIVAMLTRDLVERGLHAGEIARQVAEVMGGGGGGRPEAAQAGGRDLLKLDEALGAVGEIIERVSASTRP